MKFREVGTVIFIIFVSLCTISGVITKYLCDDDCKTVKEIAESYECDNQVEQFLEDLAEDYFDLDDDSIDISFWNDDEPKGWVKDD